jgi:Zn-dependent metalloprotease
LALSGNGLEDKAATFLSLYGEAFGSKDIPLELVPQEVITDRLGRQHLTFRQIRGGVPIFDGQLKFHFDTQGRLTAVNGVFIPNIKVSTTPALSSAQAAQTALTIANQQGGGEDFYIQQNTLYFFHTGLLQGVDKPVRLVYRVEIRGGHHFREYYYIDAHTGELTEQITGICHALDRFLYEDNTSNLIWSEGDIFPGSLDQWQQNEVVAAGHMYHFFNNAFGRVSYDGADAQMRTVNNDPNISCPNANWNGSTTNYCTGTAADDVVAHEWGHAYTEYTNDLIYQWQTGALNESYSDIWGETIDLLNGYEDTGEDFSLRTNCSNSDRWQMGEDASAFGGALRDMWDPTCDGDPGKVSDAEYHCATSDSGGVHTNSGVPNHAYALLVDGGTYNGQTISSLGFTKSAHIFWRAQSVYLTATSDFVDMADALEAACTDLMGLNLEGLSTTATPAGPSGEIITAADCTEVTEVIAAVELRAVPPCSFSPLLDQPAPDACAVGSGAQGIFSEDFESGLTGWTVTQIPSNPATWDAREWIINSSLPDGRTGSAVYGPDPIPVGDCNTDLDNGIIRLQSPVISIPGGTGTDLFMTFDHYVAMENLWDGGNIKYRVNGGGWTLLPASAFTYNGYNTPLNTAGAGNDNPMAGEDSFTGSDEGSVSSTWGQSQINLNSLGVFANDNLELRWELGADGCNGLDGWYVDDVLVYECIIGLPVELLDFKAITRGDLSVLSWATASEIQSDYFEIQRSVDGRMWENIGKVNGSGYSITPLDYVFVDKQPRKGLNYYRLKVVDLDGSFVFSPVETVRFEEGGHMVVSPNPFGRSLEVSLPSGVEGASLFLEIIDLNGKRVWSKTVESYDGGVLSLRRMEALPSGMYWLRASRADEIHVVKIIHL